jgi:hypothetical protein
MTSGVPQGSVLGPALFVLYINSVTEQALSAQSKLILYADDMVLVHPLNKANSIDEIQNDVNKLNSTILSLGLKFNSKKCKAQMITLTPSTEGNESISLGGEMLELVTTYKYLGVEIDNQLTFTPQTTKAVLKAKQAIGAMFRQLRKWAPIEVFKTSITSIVLPAFFYAIPIWYPPGNGDKIRLERVQKYAARLILNDFKKSTAYEDLLLKLDWKPLTRKVTEQRLQQMWKYVMEKEILPAEVFQMEEESHSRQSKRLLSKRNRTKMLVKSNNNQKNKKEEKLAAENMRRLWNSLEDSVIDVDSLDKFKRNIESDCVYKSLCDLFIVSVLSV